MQKRIFLFWQRIFPAVIVLVFIFGVLAGAQAAPNFKGKVITFIIPYAPGGGTDIWSRMAAQHFGKFLPGNPRIVIRNIPGGGGMIGSNKAWSSKPNGRTCLVTGGGVVANNVLRPKGIIYKLQEMHPIISVPTGNVYFVKPGLIKEPKDIVTVKGLRWGHQAATTGTAGGFVWGRELLGIKLDKMVQGYQGGGPARMAFIAGESNFTGNDTTGYITSVKKQLVDTGEAVPVWQQGILDSNGDLVKENAHPDLLTARELYIQIYGKEPSGQVWEAYKLMAGTRTFTKTILLPKATPADIVDVFRKSAIKMAKDPKFLKDSEKVAPGASYWVGETLVKLYPSAVSGPPELLKFMKKILTEKYDVVF